MRLLLVQVDKNHGPEVIQAAKEYRAVNALRFEAASAEEAIDAVILHVENDQVEKLIDQLKDLPGFSVSLIPHEVQTLSPHDADPAAKQTKEARPRSPLEVYLRGLRSTGTWKSFLGYAVVAGALSWVGLFTNTVFLLIAAMLVAPYPSPAMNTAVATARGDGPLLGRSLLRYVAVLVVGILTAAFLSTLFRQQVITDLMRSITYVSQTSFILPLMAGVAGGLFLSESEESSLVSAAGAGMLVTAALSPPVAAAGMASVLGEWTMAKRATFLLIMQIVGINLTGTLVFRYYGMSIREAWYKQGSRRVQAAIYAVTMVLFAGLLLWQFTSGPALLRPTRAQDAAAVVRKAMQESEQATFVASEVRFAAADRGEGGVLVNTVYVRPSVQTQEAALKQQLRQRIQSALQKEDFRASSVVEVTVLKSP